MSIISDSDLQDLVQQIVQRTLGSGNVISSTTSTINPAGHEPDLTLVEPQPHVATVNTVALGADHGGFSLKENLKTFLLKQGYKVDDCGTYSPDSVDYPDFAYAVAKKVSEGEAWRGIIIDGAGIGSCMVANKVRGVRAAMCYDHATALNSREHNNANVLTLGAGLIFPTLARQIVLTWLNTTFAGGRHTRRVDKITMIERRQVS